MARRRRLSEREIEGKLPKGPSIGVPKLQPGDRVPRTGQFRLDEGVRVKPTHRASHFKSQKTPRFKKIRPLARSRRR